MPVSPSNFSQGVNWRSMLFLPLSRPDRAPKAAASGADWVCLDLEDGVAAADKESARAALPSVCKDWPKDGPRLAVRINAPPLAATDMKALAALPNPPDAVVIPKVESAAILADAAAALPGAALVALIETPVGVAAAASIVAANPAPAALGFGAADYLAATGGADNNDALLFPRSAVVNAAAIAGIPALDGAWLRLKDSVGLRAAAETAKQLGFAGKVAVHPAQIAAIHAAFAPDEADIAMARKIAAAADGAGAVDGMMVDAPVIARARRILESARTTRPAKPESARRSRDWSGRFYEDFEPGAIYEHWPARTVTNTDNVWFTMLTLNTHPIHFDAEYAAKTEFGRLLVNSTFTLALVAGMTVRGTSQNAVANLGWQEIRLPSPVFVGDTLRAETEVISKRESKSRPGQGIVTCRHVGRNQRDEIVLEMTRSFLVAKRPQQEDPEAK